MIAKLSRTEKTKSKILNLLQKAKQMMRMKRGKMQK